ncbi:MAG: tRNA nucleotidyltransferase, partial [Segetibacter sp.]
MYIDCSKKELFVFKKIAHASEDLGMPAFVIGGFVRDKIIGRITKDADIVCLGDGILLADKVAGKFLPKPTVVFFKNFGTAQIKIGDFEVEFVGARKESYRSDSRNPEVEAGTLEDDQNRRDFTINALAISLNKEDFGELIDPFNGLADIEAKLIRTP